MRRLPYMLAAVPRFDFVQRRQGVALGQLFQRLLRTLSLLLLASPASAEWWHPRPGSSWHIQYSGRLLVDRPEQIINLDLFDTPLRTIRQLHARGKRVICYFSAGTFEAWRPDAGAFPAETIGTALSEWHGEWWLDISNTSAVLPIMRQRLALARAKHCDAVDPDNVDAYKHSTGFELTAQKQFVYNKTLAEAAHRLHLAVGLKNDVSQARRLQIFFDFAVNEQCFQHNECTPLLVFPRHDKPVYGIEYNLSTEQFCTHANEMGFDFVRKRRNLNSWYRPCH